MRWFAIIMLAVPLLEIALFISVGGALGVLATLTLIVATAVLGLALFRVQGTELRSRVQTAMAQDQAPVGEMLDGLGLGIAAVLLLLPGFFTDTLGLTLMVPLFRRALLVAFLVKARATVVSRYEGHSRPGGPIVDGEFTDVTDEDPKPATRSLPKASDPNPPGRDQ